MIFGLKKCFPAGYSLRALFGNDAGPCTLKTEYTFIRYILCSRVNSPKLYPQARQDLRKDGAIVPMR